MPGGKGGKGGGGKGGKGKGMFKEPTTDGGSSSPHTTATTGTSTGTDGPRTVQHTPPQQVVHVVHQPPAMVGTGWYPPFPMSEYPQHMTCPQCHQQVITATFYQTGTLTWVAFLITLFVFLPAAPFIFCSDCTKDVEHRCPSCGYCFGAYKRM